MEHPDITANSFPGGTATGAHIARTAAPMFKKLSLELGGKNPNIIFADCDYENMLETTVRSSFANQGQICLCGSRIFVEDSIFEKSAKPAFPVNISINEIAAHYTPSHTDERVIETVYLVKIDIGNQRDGYIGDMAFTYC